jgi:Tol biopolymer transport system component
VSPDGRRVAFFSQRSAPPNEIRVYVVGIDGRGLMPVAGPFSSEFQPQLSWSPDSARLALVVGGRTEAMYLVEPGQPRRLVLGGASMVDAAWSPDGRVITVIDVQSTPEVQAVAPEGKRLWRAPGNRYAWSAAGRIAVSGGGVVTIYDELGHRLARFAARSFAWASAGDRLASLTSNRLEVRTGDGRLVFHRTVPGLPRKEGGGLVWTDATRVVIFGIASRAGRIGVDLQTGKLWAPTDRDLGLRSPDGRFVAARLVAGRGLELSISRLDGSGRRTLVRVEGCLDDGVPTGIDWLQFTHDGRSLVYQSSCPEPLDHLDAIRPDGTGLHRVTHELAEEQRPEWSPDGTRIAFERSQFTGLSCKGCPSTIWVARADGSHPVRLTSPRFCVFDGSASWSPDGREIVFSRDSCDAPGELMVVAVTGGRPRTLHVAGAEPTWGPAKIAYTDAQHALWTVDSDGRGARMVASGPAYSPAWSRDGRLAFLEFPSGPAVVDVAGRRLRLPLRDPRGLAWSPDGTHLVLGARLSPNGPIDVYTVGTDGRGLKRLTHNVGAAGVSWRG